MKRALVILFALALAGPLFSEGETLKQSELYTSITTMQGDGYTLQVREAGPIEKNKATGGGYALDGDPFVHRDFIPPSQPDGLQGVALDAHSIQLTFLASTDNIRVLRYNIYRDGHQVATSPTTSYTDSGLTAMTLYHYNVQAVDKSLNLSPLSDTVTVATLDPTTQNAPPRFVVSPFVRYLTSTEAVIGFTTDKATNATVDNGPTAAYGSSVTQADYLTDHVVSLTGLAPGTRYHYRVTVNDFSGHGPVVSKDDSFSSSFGGDAQAPTFRDGPEVGYLSDTIAVITFTTNEDAKGSVSFGTGSPSGSREDEPDFDTIHAVTLANLSPSTSYSYQVSISDRSGNGPVLSQTRTFTTRNNPDGEAPEIVRKPDIEYVSDHLAIITWDTDKLSDAAVNFGTSRGTYDRLATSPVLAMHHLVALTDLSPDSQYFFTAWSTDPSGNASDKTREKVFTTNRSPDKNPPAIMNIRVVAGGTTATISWSTSELSDGKLVFGTRSGEFSGQVYDGALLEDHVVTVQGLVTGTTYYFEVVARDPSGNEGQSKQYSFRTDWHDNGNGNGHGNGNGQDNGNGHDNGNGNPGGGGMGNGNG
jgi:chitodextrinase